MTNTESPSRDFTLTWTLDATPADVFRAWTDPEHLQWFYKLVFAWGATGGDVAGRDGRALPALGSAA